MERICIIMQVAHQMQKNDKVRWGRLIIVLSIEAILDMHPATFLDELLYSCVNQLTFRQIMRDAQDRRLLLAVRIEKTYSVRVPGEYPMDTASTP